MAQVQIPNAMYQERTALLDRIQSFDVGARRPNRDRLAETTESTRAHIAYANARLDKINYMIACLKMSTCR
jgi:hypothetical protein